MPTLLFTVTTDLTYDQRMQRICTTLAAAGYRVRLIGRELPGSKALAPRPYQQTRLRCRFYRGKRFYVEYNLRLLWHLLGSPADLICGVDLDTALPAWAVARLRGIPFVHDAHEYFPEMEEVARRSAVQRAWRWVEGFVLRRTRYAYTVSTSIARQLEADYGCPFGVIRNAPRLGPLSAPTVSPNPYLVYVGAVNEGRGLEQLIDALPQTDSTLHLWVCGQGDVYEDVVARATDRGVAHRVRFLGYVLPADLPPILAGAWAGYLMLTRCGLSYYYSLANKFFDYVHAGIPQITVDFPEYRALNAEYEVSVLTELDAGQIAEAINRLWADPAYRERLATNARAARQVWHWEVEAAKLRALYARLLPVPALATTAP